MLVNQDTCTGCEICVPYCPVGAISMREGLAAIDRDECVECGVCYRASGCPVDAFIQTLDDPWPRSIRHVLSNPLTESKDTRVPGRGTEEMKTNEVTGRFRPGFVGVAVELGRPGVGTRFHDVQRVSQAVAELGVEFESQNPVTFLMTDKKKGTLNPDVLNEKVLSAIIEIGMPMEKLKPVLRRLQQVAQEVDTVFSVVLGVKVDPNGSIPTEPTLKEMGIPVAPNGKCNVGLGRPRFQF